MPDYIGITTFPSHTSGNVGDKLITDSGIRILREIKGPLDISVYYRGRDLGPAIEELNESRAVLLFGFPVKERRTKPDLYQLVEPLEKLKTPIIPLGTALSFFPGTPEVRESIRFGKGTSELLDRCRRDSPGGRISARTSWVESVLERHGYGTLMTGDMAWYHPDHVGGEVHCPDQIGRLIFTPPHGPMYVRQAARLLRTLSDRFSNVERIVSYQSQPTSVDRKIERMSRKLGWEQRFTSHDTDKLKFYSQSDLHVGYRKHGHLAHLRLRRPSVLLAEDSRGAGLLDTLGGGGMVAFDARFPRFLTPAVRSGLDIGREYISRTLFGQPDVGKSYQNMAMGKARRGVGKRVVEFIDEQLEAQWPAYRSIMNTIDVTYHEALVPFIEEIP